MSLINYFTCFKHSPRYSPRYVAVWRRILSYNSCPTSAIIPLKFAEAGFYFEGTEEHPDATRCYACGLVLRNWEPGDDPWVEHARHRPRCSHLYLNMGWPFIRDIQRSGRPTIHPGDNHRTDEPTCIICSTNTISVVFLPCEHACLCRLCSPTVESCPLCRVDILYSIKFILP